MKKIEQDRRLALQIQIGQGYDAYLRGDYRPMREFMSELASELGLPSTAAVELGKRGGLKGGRARAEKLSAKRRKEIARNAAQVRWAKHQEEE